MKTASLLYLATALIGTAASALSKGPLTGLYTVQSAGCSELFHHGDSVAIVADNHFLSLNILNKDNGAYDDSLEANLAAISKGHDATFVGEQPVRLRARYSNDQTQFDYSETFLKFAESPADKVIRRIHLELNGKVLTFLDNTSERPVCTALKI